MGRGGESFLIDAILMQAAGKNIKSENAVCNLNMPLNMSQEDDDDPTWYLWPLLKSLSHFYC